MSRPHIASSIDEMTDEFDATEFQDHKNDAMNDIRDELAFRRGSKKVRKLAKALGCQWKVSASTGVPSDSGAVAAMPASASESAVL